MKTLILGLCLLVAGCGAPLADCTANLAAETALSTDALALVGQMAPADAAKISQDANQALTAAMKCEVDAQSAPSTAQITADAQAIIQIAVEVLQIIPDIIAVIPKDMAVAKAVQTQPARAAQVQAALYEISRRLEAVRTVRGIK